MWFDQQSTAAEEALESSILEIAARLAPWEQTCFSVDESVSLLNTAVSVEGNELEVAYWLTYLFTYSLTHLLRYLLTYSLIYLLTHLFTYLLTHLLT
jgi:hypothetical protein